MAARTIASQIQHLDPKHSTYNQKYSLKSAWIFPIYPPSYNSRKDSDLSATIKHCNVLGMDYGRLGFLFCVGWECKTLSSTEACSTTQLWVCEINAVSPFSTDDFVSLSIVVY